MANTILNFHFDYPHPSLMKNTYVRNVVQYCDLWYALSVKPGSLKPNLANTPRGFLEGSWKALQSLFYAFEALRSINGYIYNIYALLHFINSWYLNTFSPQEC